MSYFAFIYFMKPEPEAVREAVPAHVEYWEKAAVGDYRGGPFADRTGGLITFAVEGADQAEILIQSDPFVLNGLLERYWLKDWLPVQQL